jgi:hypothetical protein
MILLGEIIGKGEIVVTGAIIARNVELFSFIKWQMQ